MNKQGFNHYTEETLEHTNEDFCQGTQMSGWAHAHTKSTIMSTNKGQTIYLKTFQEYNSHILIG